MKGSISGTPCSDSSEASLPSADGVRQRITARTSRTRAANPPSTAPTMAPVGTDRDLGSEFSPLADVDGEDGDVCVCVCVPGTGRLAIAALATLRSHHSAKPETQGSLRSL